MAARTVKAATAAARARSVVPEVALSGGTGSPKASSTAHPAAAAAEHMDARTRGARASPRPRKRRAGARAQKPRAVVVTCSKCGMAMAPGAAGSAEAGGSTPSAPHRSGAGADAGAGVRVHSTKADATAPSARSAKPRKRGRPKASDEASSDDESAQCADCRAGRPRARLRSVTAFDDVVAALKAAKRVVVLCGAGISVSCGLPGEYCACLPACLRLPAPAVLCAD